MFCKKGVLRNLTKFTGNHLCQSLFFNKVAGTFSHRTPLVTASVTGRILGGQKFKVKKYSRNLFWRFWPQIAKLNSAKIIEIGSIAKICFAKFNFSSDIFVYLAVTAEQLYNKD